MAAFGESHDESELWALTALVRQFLEMSPDEYEYRPLVQQAQLQESADEGQEAPHKRLSISANQRRTGSAASYAGFRAKFARGFRCSPAY